MYPILFYFYFMQLSMLYIHTGYSLVWFNITTHTHTYHILIVQYWKQEKHNNNNNTLRSADFPHEFNV